MKEYCGGGAGILVYRMREGPSREVILLQRRAALASKNDRHVFVYNKTKETFLAFRVTVADSIVGRLIGCWASDH